MLWTLLFLILLYKVGTWALARIRLGKYDDKFVFITGCDTGFGNLLVKRLDRLGFHVFAACLTAEGADRLKTASSDRVVTLRLDVTDAQSIAAAKELVERHLPPGKGLWGVVNNAGIAGAGVPAEWQTAGDWRSVLEVNILGVVNVTMAFLPLVRRARGRVVNMASTLGRIALTPAPYSVSKYGVEAFSDCLRREVYPHGVKVCILEPGYFRTDILDMSRQVDVFNKRYEACSSELKNLYPYLTPDMYPKLANMVHEKASGELSLVVDAYELTLTSMFPPTRQQVGYDVRLFFRLLWNLPAPLCDFVMNYLLQNRVKALQNS